jgi:SAM-dependent methyltransferase
VLLVGCGGQTSFESRPFSLFDFGSFIRSHSFLLRTRSLPVSLFPLHSILCSTTTSRCNREKEASKQNATQNMTENEQPIAKRPKQNDPAGWYIFPPKQRAEFRVGQTVWLKTNDGGERYKRGSISVVDGGGSGNVHVHVEGDPTGTIATKLGKKDQRRRLLPDLSGKRTILVTPETNHFRQLVGHVMHSDTVLEIGCSSGETSKLLIQNCQSWVGFDTSEEMLDICMKMMASAPVSATKQRHFVIVNALIDKKKAGEEARRFGTDPNVIFLDIGGNRESIGVLRMISWVLEEFDPRLVVIKSRELVQSIKSSSHKIDATTGFIDNGHEWFRLNRQKPALPKHPLKAALVMSPVDSNKPICRYHNYHKNGCKKDDCAFDHVHCHACLRPGHVAKECHLLSRETE